MAAETLRHRVEKSRQVEIIRVLPSDDLAGRPFESLIDDAGLPFVRLADPGGQVAFVLLDDLNASILTPSVIDHDLHIRIVLVENGADGSLQEHRLVIGRHHYRDPGKGGIPCADDLGIEPRMRYKLPDLLGRKCPPARG